MNREALLPLEGYPVILIKKDGYSISGMLKNVWDDSITIVSDNALRVICFSEIAEIKKRGGQ